MKQIITVILLLISASISAQEITVKSLSESVNDLSARTSRRYDVNDEACALIKVQYPKPGATFDGMVIGDAEFRNGEYWVYVSRGTKRLILHLPEVPTITVIFADYGINQVASNTTYSLEFKFPEVKSGLKTRFYVSGGFDAGGLMAPDLGVGVYLGNFNVELDVLLPMGAKQELYANAASKSSEKYTYKPAMMIGGLIGYGIHLNDKFRFTPQAGLMYLKTSESTQSYNSEPVASGAYCTSVDIRLKFEYFVTKNISLGIAPEYSVPAIKSDGFKALADASTKIAKWNNGIGAALTVNIQF